MYFKVKTYFITVLGYFSSRCPASSFFLQFQLILEKRQTIFSKLTISLNIYRLICQFCVCQILSPLAIVYQPHFSKFLQQNIKLGQQVCTGTVSEQHFAELLSSSLVECLLLTPRFLGWNPETGELREEEESFRDVYSESKGPTGRSQIFQMLSDSPIAYSLEPTTALAFRGGPNIRATWPTSRSLLGLWESNLIYVVETSF